MAANSVVCGPIWPKFELVQDFMHALDTCKYKKDGVKSNREKVKTPFSSSLVNGGFLLPWTPEFWSNMPQNIVQPFPIPSDATHKIWSRLANWLQRYSSLKVWTTTTDDDNGQWRRTDRPLVYYKLTLWAFSSDELTNALRITKGNNSNRIGP